LTGKEGGISGGDSEMFKELEMQVTSSCKFYSFSKSIMLQCRRAPHEQFKANDVTKKQSTGGVLNTNVVVLLNSSITNLYSV